MTKTYDCSWDCINEVGKPPTADEYWHHIDCPMHTVACCSRPVTDEEDN